MIRYQPILITLAASLGLFSISAFGDYNVGDYGATGNGVTDDTSAIQSAIDACDNAGGGTVFFPPGHYNEIGLTVGSLNTSTNHRQSYIFLEGAAPHASVIRYIGASDGIAIKTTSLIGGGIKRLDLVNVLARGTTDGLQTSGTVGANGTSTNNCILEHVSISGFHNGWHTSDGIATTSSEITAVNLILSNCDNGFLNDSYNGLNFTFIQLQTSQNTIGIYAHTAGVYVLGGSADHNGTDFRVENGGTHTIHGFRSETAGRFLDDSGPLSISVMDCICQAMTGADAITLGTNNHISIRDSEIGGNIKASDHAANVSIDVVNTVIQSGSSVTIGNSVTNGRLRIFGSWTCIGNFNNITPIADGYYSFGSANGIKLIAR